MFGGNPAWMHTSVAPYFQASLALDTISSIGKRYPSSCLKSLLKAQNPHCFIHTFVKLIFLLTTYVTTLPFSLLLNSSAIKQIMEVSISLLLNSFMASEFDISLLLSDLSNMIEISGSIFFNIVSIFIVCIPL